MRSFALALALSSLPGCFGSFELTKAIYQFNKDVSDEIIVQELVFLAMVIIPVYGFGAGIDAIVLNTLEFVTGDNPMGSALPESRIAKLPDGRTLVVIEGPDGAWIELDDALGERKVRRLRRRANRMELLEGGEIIAAAELAGDGGIWVDAGEGPRHVDVAQVEAIGAAVHSGDPAALGDAVAVLQD